MPIMNTEKEIEFDNAFHINLINASVYKRFISFVIDAIIFQGLVGLAVSVMMVSTAFYIKNFKDVNGVDIQISQSMITDFVNGTVIYSSICAALIPFLMGTFRKGRTIGRQYNSLVIVSKSGKSAPFWRLIIRFLAKVVTVYIGLGIGLIFMILNKDNRAFHDIISGTKVAEIEQPDPVEVIAVNDPDNYDPKTGKLMEEKLTS